MAMLKGEREGKGEREDEERKRNRDRKENTKSYNLLQRLALNYLKLPTVPHSFKLRPSTTVFLGDTLDPNHSPPNKTFILFLLQIILL